MHYCSDVETYGVLSQTAGVDVREVGLKNLQGHGERAKDMTVLKRIEQSALRIVDGGPDCAH